MTICLAHQAACLPDALRHKMKTVAVKDQKVALITGAAGHLGQAASTRFLAKGYRVVASVSPGKQPMKVEGVKRQPEWSPVDLRNEREAKGLLNNVLAKYKHIDAALLLAGGFSMGKLEETGKKELQDMFELNFFTAYNVVKPVFEHMCKQSVGGHMVFVSARPALDSEAGQHMISYAMSKSMIIKLAEFINAAGKEQGVTASVFVPSIIDTPANRKAMPKADFSSWVKPEAIAELMEQVCSDNGKVLRETVFKVYGGA